MMKEELQIKKERVYAEMIAILKIDDTFLTEMIDLVQWWLNSKEKSLNKSRSNIWLIVKNLKPESLEELRKLIIPEVFEDVGLVELNKK